MRQWSAVSGQLVGRLSSALSASGTWQKRTTAGGCPGDSSERVQIVQLPEAAVHALSSGCGLAAANAAATVPLTSFFGVPA